MKADEVQTGFMDLGDATQDPASSVTALIRTRSFFLIILILITAAAARRRAAGEQPRSP